MNPPLHVHLLPDCTWIFREGDIAALKILVSSKDAPERDRVGNVAEAPDDSSRAIRSDRFFIPLQLSTFFRSKLLQIYSIELGVHQHSANATRRPLLNLLRQETSNDVHFFAKCNPGYRVVR